MCVNLFNARKKIGFDIAIFYVISLQVLYYIFLVIAFQDFTNVNLAIQLLSLFCVISYIRFFVGFPLFVRSLINVMIAMAIGGSLIFFAHIIVGVNPLFTVTYGEDTSFFLWLTTTNIYVNSDAIRIIRYSGFFDEPGNFALYSCFAILLNKIYFKSKKTEFVLFFFTLFTFSMAFYFTMLVYFFLFYINPKRLLYVIPFILFIPIAFGVLEKVDPSTYKIINEMTFERFAETQNNLSETNRGELMQNDYKLFIDNPFFGVGNKEGGVAGANIYAILAKYGIIGSLFFYSFLIVIAFLALKKPLSERFFYFKILIIILISFFHRPELSSVFTLLIFYLIIFEMRASGIKDIQLKVS